MNLTQHQPTPRKPIAIATGLEPAYLETVTIECEECGGSGRDPGSLDSIFEGEAPVCPRCHGLCIQTITRNYLSEAFAIAQNPDSRRIVERAHIIAVIRFARAHVSALYQMPEVA
jgi:hypothetical protein